MAANLGCRICDFLEKSAQGQEQRGGRDRKLGQRHLLYLLLLYKIGRRLGWAGTPMLCRFCSVLFFLFFFIFIFIFSFFLFFLPSDVCLLAYISPFSKPSPSKPGFCWPLSVVFKHWPAHRQQDTNDGSIEKKEVKKQKKHAQLQLQLQLQVERILPRVE